MTSASGSKGATPVAPELPEAARTGFAAEQAAAAQEAELAAMRDIARDGAAAADGIEAIIEGAAPDDAGLMREALGLPKPRVPGTPVVSANKIKIPGGKYKPPGVPKPAKGWVYLPDDDEEEEEAGEWTTNGVGRVDVRGFRELRI